MDINQICIIEVDDTTVAECGDRGSLGDCADEVGTCQCDGGRVVCTHHRDSDRLADRAAIAVVDCDGKGLCGGLTVGKVLRRCIGQAVSPAHCAIGRIGRLTDSV